MDSEDQAKVELYDAKGSLVAPLFEGKVEANQIKYLIFRAASQKARCI